jgi:hypothetical protein
MNTAFVKVQKLFAVIKTILVLNITMHALKI